MISATPYQLCQMLAYFPTALPEGHEGKDTSVISAKFRWQTSSSLPHSWQSKKSLYISQKTLCMP